MSTGEDASSSLGTNEEGSGQPPQPPHDDSSSSAAAVQKPEASQQQGQSQAAAALFEIAATPSVTVESDRRDIGGMPSMKGSNAGDRAVAEQQSGGAAVTTASALTSRLRLTRKQQQQLAGSAHTDESICAEAPSLESSAAGEVVPARLTPLQGCQKVVVVRAQHCQITILIYYWQRETFQRGKPFRECTMAHSDTTSIRIDHSNC